MIQELEQLCKNIMKHGNEIMRQWQWGQGVALFAIERAYYKTGNKEYIQYIKDWIESHLKEGTPGFSINTSAPLNGVMALYDINGDEKYQELCQAFAEYLLTENPRCEKGGFEHTCTGNNCPNQMWVDTVFMSGIFLARYGLKTGKSMYVNEALRQLVIHYDFLHNPETGLLHHGYYSDDRQRHGVQWGRGNGWFAAASAVILEMLDDTYPLKKAVEERYVKHINALLNFQRADGAWGTVINDESSYSETTGTSGAAYGLAKAIQMGYIGAEYEKNKDLAYEFLKSKIDENSAMTCGSDGTCVMESAEEYKNIKFRCSEFSQGLAILAFSI